MIAFQTAMRAAACKLLRDYGKDIGVKLTVFEARPSSVVPPHAFIDRISESTDYTAQVRERTVRVEAVVLHGTFDTLSAVQQRDKFCDGFIDWVTDRIHAAADNTAVGVVAMADDPSYTADWLNAEQQTFFATRITLEGTTSN